MKYKQPDDNNMPIIARETPTCSVMSGTKKHIDKITVSRLDEKTVRPKADAVINTKPRNPISRNTNLRFMILFLSSFLFFLLLLLSANIYVDPRGVFGTGKYPVITATSRTEKIILLKAMEPKPEALIFGSSHCMRYSPKYVEDITGLKTFNFSVDSGKMEDFLALLNYSIEENKIWPKLVILGVCPRTFCEMKDEDLDDRLVSNAVLLNYVPLKPISNIQKQAALYFKTLNFNYIKDLRRSIKLSRRQKLPLKRYKFEADGFLATEEDFNKKGMLIPKDASFTGFSQQRIEFLEAFLKICRQNDIKLKIVITPYAPDYIKQMEQNGENLSMLNKQLAELLKRHNKEFSFELYEFPHIEDYSGVDEFMGAAHPSIYNSNLILKKMFRQI